jgi:hypothetical protein
MGPGATNLVVENRVAIGILVDCPGSTTALADNVIGETIGAASRLATEQLCDDEGT